MRFNQHEKIAHEKGYRVNDEGIVTGLKGSAVGFTHSGGYRKFKIRDDKGNNLDVSIHRLQAYQKFGDSIYEEGMVVRHLDGDPKNNTKDNIAIGTMRDNIMDRPARERLEHALHATSFVRKYDKEEVRAYHKEHQSYQKTMDHFKISSKGTLHHILNK